ncbi:MAG: hypothetical protein QMC48_10095 [SAR324 cluster bacterium]|jgi:hypothetical protein|tara:strand:- start:248 stop:421 length:174 start_codon:yes stop_codon:yes gene_type:complete
MLIGLEYVIAAYFIWLNTFVVYIILTKRRLEKTGHTVAELEERFSGTSAANQNGSNI